MVELAGSKSCDSELAGPTRALVDKEARYGVVFNYLVPRYFPLESSQPPRHFFYVDPITF
jgi:hypothetical protein